MKGQWFVISAVVLSGIFFGMSLLLGDYFAVDSSRDAALNGDYYFYSISEQFDKIVATTPTNVSCINLTTNLNELKTTSERFLAPRGLFVFLNYSVVTPCLWGGPNNGQIDLLIASKDQIVYNFTRLRNISQVLTKR